MQMTSKMVDIRRADEIVLIARREQNGLRIVEHFAGSIDVLAGVAPMYSTKRVYKEFSEGTSMSWCYVVCEGTAQ